MTRTGRLSDAYQDLSLTDIHRAVGFGRQKFLSPYTTCLRGVELVVRLDNQELYHATDPVVERFPDVDHLIPDDRPGISTVEFRTPVGTLVVEYTMLDQMIASGTRNYMSKHPICDPADYDTVEYILTHAEFVPEIGRLQSLEAEFGAAGFVVPMMERIPFQQLLIDYFSTDEFFYALYDYPQKIDRLLAILDERVSGIVRRLAYFPVPYIEIGDNLDGMMTNPKLFARYCLPAYQRYTELIHSQGKRMGSHTDGNLKPLLELLAETGLDICESFSPSPLTPCTVEDALRVWETRPVIWGGIPSPRLEQATGEAEFEQYMQNLLATVGSRPIILNVTDMVLPNNSIDRIRRIASLVENHVI